MRAKQAKWVLTRPIGVLRSKWQVDQSWSTTRLLSQYAWKMHWEIQVDLVREKLTIAGKASKELITLLDVSSNGLFAW